MHGVVGTDQSWAPTIKIFIDNRPRQSANNTDSRRTTSRQPDITNDNNNRRSTTNTRQPTRDSWQPTIINDNDNRQSTTYTRQPTYDNKQPTTMNDRQSTTNSRQPTYDNQQPCSEKLLKNFVVHTYIFERRGQGWVTCLYVIFAVKLMSYSSPNCPNIKGHKMNNK